MLCVCLLFLFLFFSLCCIICLQNIGRLYLFLICCSFLWLLALLCFLWLLWLVTSKVDQCVRGLMVRQQCCTCR